MAKLEDFKASAKSGAWAKVHKQDKSSTVRSIRKNMAKKMGHIKK